MVKGPGRLIRLPNLQQYLFYLFLPPLFNHLPYHVHWDGFDLRQLLLGYRSGRDLAFQSCDRDVALLELYLFPAPACADEYLSTAADGQDAQAALRFLHAISSYDWPLAAVEVDRLQKAREGGIAWLSDDLFRDGATIALLHYGDLRMARAVFDRMAEFVARKPNDLRVRLLEAHIGALEKKAKNKGE